jgi:hypothetical protein
MEGWLGIDSIAAAAMVLSSSSEEILPRPQQSEYQQISIIPIVKLD